MSDAVNVNVIVGTGSGIGAVTSHDGVASSPNAELSAARQGKTASRITKLTHVYHPKWQFKAFHTINFRCNPS
jgi:hypothetical protein